MMIHVDPEDVLFTQDSIDHRFKTGPKVDVANAKSYAEALELGEQLLLSKVMGVRVADWHSATHGIPTENGCRPVVLLLSICLFTLCPNPGS